MTSGARPLAPAGRGGSTNPPRGKVGGPRSDSGSTNPPRGVVGTAPLGTSSTKPVNKVGKQGSIPEGSFSHKS